MFSTTTPEGGPATATRSRRRQRPKSSESLVPQPKAKRQRVPLTEQTFVNPEADEPEPRVESKIDKASPPVASPDSNIENLYPSHRKELNVRTKKSKHGDRAAQKGDGSLLLVGTYHVCDTVCFYQGLIIFLCID